MQHDVAYFKMTRNKENPTTEMSFFSNNLEKQLSGLAHPSSILIHISFSYGGLKTGWSFLFLISFPLDYLNSCFEKLVLMAILHS